MAAAEIDSPPRVRGARGRAESCGGRWRLTPACAGSTCNMGSAGTFGSTHPRVCGEHFSMSTLVASSIDSPPRVRGARSLAIPAVTSLRLTPACAGSTLRLRQPTLQRPTHPRVCGEHGDEPLGRMTMFDSPPRVRGAPSHLYLRLREPSTHPRVCGEHPSITISLPNRIDSPPRVRGALISGTRGGYGSRLTPACAGSTDHQSTKAER